MRIGYNTNGLAHHRLEDALRLLADHGYTAVALTPDAAHLDPWRATAAEVSAIAALLERLDLVCVVETGSRYLLDPGRKHRPGLMEEDAAERARRLDFLERCLVLARDLRAGVVSFFSGHLPEGVAPQTGWDRLVEGVELVMGAAARCGLRVGLEPEPGMVVQTVADWRRLRGRVGPNLGLVLDVGHLLATREGDPAETILQRAGDLVQVHLEDARAGVHEHLLPGEGELDFAAVKGALTASGYAGPVCFELSRHSHRAAEAVALCMRAWRDPASVRPTPTGNP